MKTQTTSDERYFEAGGQLVGHTDHIDGDGSYDGLYETTDSYYWIERHGYRRRCSQHEITDFIRTYRPRDCQGLASYYARALQVGRLIHSASPLFDFVPVTTGRPTTDPVLIGAVLRFWTLIVPDMFTTGRKLPYRILEHGVSLDTSAIIDQHEVWSGHTLITTSQQPATPA